MAGFAILEDALEAGAQFNFDPVDHRFMRRRERLSPGQRLEAMLSAREWVVSGMRARLAKRYPELSPQDINLKVLEEIDRVERRRARSQPLP